MQPGDKASSQEEGTQEDKAVTSFTTRRANSGDRSREGPQPTLLKGEGGPRTIMRKDTDLDFDAIFCAVQKRKKDARKDPR